MNVIFQSQEYHIVYSKDISKWYSEQCLIGQSNTLVSSIVSLQKCVDSIMENQKIN